MSHLAHIALIVRDYDEALAYYVGKLGFELVEDTYQPAQDKRWVTIRPPRSPDGATAILLSRASNDHQARYIGDQAGGRVFLFLATDDFARDYAAFTVAGGRMGAGTGDPRLRYRRRVQRSLWQSVGPCAVRLNRSYGPESPSKLPKPISFRPNSGH